MLTLENPTRNPNQVIKKKTRSDICDTNNYYAHPLKYWIFFNAQKLLGYEFFRLISNSGNSKIKKC